MPHPLVIIDGMTEQLPDDLPPLTTCRSVPAFTPIGTVVDRWNCPCCDRVIDIVHRPGRPRVYCSHACRQRAFRWRRRHGAHTVSTPEWPAEEAVALGQRRHAFRTSRDPLSRRRDRRGREVTACGVLSRPNERARAEGVRVPFLGADQRTCATCATLTQPRPLGLVPAEPWTLPGAGDFADRVRALRAVSPDYPLDPVVRHLAHTAWAA